MKKCSILLAAVILFLAAMPVQAAVPRMISVYPSISYSESVAACSVTVFAENPSDCIEITVKFWYGNLCLRTWTASGCGTLVFSETTAATKGRTYRLTVDSYINGVKQPTNYTSKKYE